jgi:phage gp46-like protein
VSDFKTVFVDLVSGARYSITDTGIEEDGSLVTAVMISLFTDKRDPLAQPDNARGFWGDDEIGSLRWTIVREKQTQEVLNRLIKYDTDALQWLQKAGYVTAITITADWVARGVLHEKIILTLPDGSQVSYQVEES